MRHLLRQLAVLGIVVGLIWVVTAWPRLNDVETGKTPEYPDLRPHDYGASIDTVVRGVKAAASRVPRFEIVGVGSGPAGSEIQAVKTGWPAPLKYDVSIRLRRDKGRTLVTVRSKSRAL